MYQVLVEGLLAETFEEVRKLQNQGRLIAMVGDGY